MIVTRSRVEADVSAARNRRETGVLAAEMTEDGTELDLGTLFLRPDYYLRGIDVTNMRADFVAMTRDGYRRSYGNESPVFAPDSEVTSVDVAALRQQPALYTS